MDIISSRDFRQNMGNYLDAINNGESIIMKTRSRGSFRILPVKDDEDSLSAKEAFRDAFRELKAYLKGETDALTEEEFWNEVNRED